MKQNLGRNLKVGGVKRDRTADLLNAIQALSQLSYNPKKDLVFYLFMPYNILKFTFCKINF